MVKPFSIIATTVKLPFHAAGSVASIAISVPPVSWASDLLRGVLYRGVDTMMRVVARLTKEPAKDSEHLKGVHTPQPKQISIPDARVTGTIPADLVGMFVNVNPNPQYLPIGGYHIFEGDGALTSVRIHGDGHASFAYTHFDTAKRRHEKALGRSNELSVMAMRGRSGLALLLMNVLKRKLAKKKYSRSTANTNIEEHGGRLYALWEGGLPHELTLTPDGTSMQIKRQLAYEEYEGPFSAHPVAHPTNGNWYSVSYMMGNTTQDAAIVVLDGKSQFVHAVPLHLGRKPMIHDAAITNKYVIVLDLPVLLTPEDILKPNGGVIRIHEDKPGRIGLFPVDGTSEADIIWFEVPSCASFHALNAHDTADGVVLHLCQFPRFNLVTLNDIVDSKLVRYELNVRTGAVDITTRELGLDAKFGRGTFVDFPFVNPARVGRDARHGFATVLVPSADRTSIRNRGVCKFDLQTGKPAAAILFPGDGLGEAGFVPKKGAVDEDDGYLLQFVKRDDGNTVMNVYDAVDMCETPVATVHAPEGYHVPSGFHSQFIDSHTLNRIYSRM